MATVVLFWAQGERIKWVFHILYYPQANGIIEQAKGLIKKYADISVMSHNPVGTHDSHKRSSLSVTTEGLMEDPKSGYFALRGHQQAMTLTKQWKGPASTKNTRGPTCHGKTTFHWYCANDPSGLYTWEALSENGETHSISTSWIILDL